jgi:Tol biopolymer transport system component
MQNGALPEVNQYDSLSEVQIRAQLQKILASNVFSRSDRISGFLRYVVEETLRGNGSALKEPVIGHHLYSREYDYDPHADPIVRVDARRLRDKLREYYAGAPADSVVITLPKGSYVPFFEKNPAARPVPVLDAPQAPSFPARVRLRRRNIVGVGAIVCVLGFAGILYQLNPFSHGTIRIRPLTSLPGLEGTPSLSPDGNFVVFTWANGGPTDLYIKAVDREPLRRLTETPEPEFSPAWSPDGRDIAFIRGRQGIFVVSALGGVERKIADGGTHVRWAADSRSVFLRATCSESSNIFCIDRIRIDTLERSRIVRAGLGGSTPRDLWLFSASPDGLKLAFIGGERPGVADLYVVPLAGGPPQQLTTLRTVIHSVDWTPDSKNLIYSADPGSGRTQLWRISAAGSGPGEPLTGGQVETASEASTARTADNNLIRVAYTSSVRNISLRAVELQPLGPTQPVGTAVPLAAQTLSHDCGGAFSPDSEQYIYRSYRSGEVLLWIVRRDGSNLRSLSPPGVVKGRPFESAWSPDGRRIAFELVGRDGNSDLYKRRRWRATGTPDNREFN